MGHAISAQLLPDGRIFSPGLDGKISVYQSRESGMVQLKGYPNALRTLAFSPDNQWLVAAGSYLVIRFECRMRSDHQLRDQLRDLMFSIFLPSFFYLRP